MSFVVLRRHGLSKPKRRRSRSRSDALFVRGYTPRCVYRLHAPSVVHIDATDKHNALRYVRRIEARVAADKKWTSRVFPFHGYMLLQHSPST